MGWNYDILFKYLMVVVLKKKILQKVKQCSSDLCPYSLSKNVIIRYSLSFILSH